MSSLTALPAQSQVQAPQAAVSPLALRVLAPLRALLPCVPLLSRAAAAWPGEKLQAPVPAPCLYPHWLQSR